MPRYKVDGTYGIQDLWNNTTTILYVFMVYYLINCHRFGINVTIMNIDRLCGLVVRVLGYGSGGPGSIPGTTRKKSSGSGTGSTQPREYK
jgi:hypothetical protein